MTAGYSGTPLPKKLGITDGSVVRLFGAPDGFEIAEAGDGVADVIVSFHTERADLAAVFVERCRSLHVDGGLWIAWPKKASKVPTDITEDTVREVALPTGMVDNKVCAIDDVWSGLRVVLRKELRKGRETAL